MISSFIDFILHMDSYLSIWSQQLGPWLFVLMFLVIFCETGLVVTPFLPGDSLLFALGAVMSLRQNPSDIYVMAGLLTVAAILGDNVNYSIGKWFGPKVFKYKKSVLFNPDHLVKAQVFFDKYGAKAILLARFAPIVRTFVPFVSGIANMNRSVFMKYNIVGGILWINSFLFAGFFFAGNPIVKQNFHTIIIGVIIVSVLPIVYEVIAARINKSKIKAS